VTRARCAHCNTSIAGRPKKTRFCGVVCRQRAAYRRRAGVPEDTPRDEIGWDWHRHRQRLIEQQQPALAL